MWFLSVCIWFILILFWVEFSKKPAYRDVLFWGRSSCVDLFLRVFYYD